MRNVKVNVQADTSQAVGKVRELTGALSQLDAATRRNVQFLLQALGSAGLKAQQIGSVPHQQASASQARAQLNANRSTSGSNQSSQSDTKNGETLAKLNQYTLKAAESQFNLFAEDLGQIFSKAFSELFQGNLKNALTGLRDSLKGLFNSLLKQLVEDLAGKIKKSITSNIKGLFNKGGEGLKTGTGQSSSQQAANVSNVTGGDSGQPTPAASEGLPVIRGGGPVPLDYYHTHPATEIETINTVPKGVETSKVVSTTGTNVAANAGKFSWDNLGKMVGSMAPALGSSFGGMLGGTSTVGSIMGSVGGLLGGAGIGLLTGAIGTGATPGFGVTAAGAPILGTMAASGILIGVAAALMIGAYILGKNKQRKADEKTRNQAMVDAFSQLDEILKQINRDEIDGASGVSSANNIRKQYVDQMSKLKDKKTRNIALKDVSRIDSKISLIKQAADNQSARKAMDAKLVPTFADGGFVGTGNGYRVLGSDGEAMQPFRGRVPGVYDRRDDFLARLSGNEVVLTPDQWMPIAPYLKQKRVPGFADGGLVSNTSSINGSSQASSNQEIIIEELIINLNNSFGAETAARIVDVGLKTPDGRSAVVKSVRAHIGESGLGDGMIRDINMVNSRGF